MKEVTIKSYPLCDTISTSNSPKANNACRLVKHFTTDSSTTNTASKTEKEKWKKHIEPMSSPYLTGDRVQLLSRVTEKKVVHKKTMDYTSSFPLAVNIYKANSDEFKTLKRSNKKNKKSVLTLPNDPGTQICTVSDMNDSEYYSRTNINNKPRLSRATTKNVRKSRVKNKSNDFYDTPFRSQLHINLSGSPTDLMAKYKGDGKIIYQASTQDSLHLPGRTEIKNNDMTPHDVWELLRNMNRFQFSPSPPMSEESIIVPKKKKTRKRINRKDTRFIETRRTEEIAYISSYTVGDSSRSLTQSSSFDRITVIDNNDEFKKISNVEDKFLKIRYPKVNNKKTVRDSKHKVEKRKVKNGSVRNICYPLAKGKRTGVTLKEDSNNIIQTNIKDYQSYNEVSSLVDIDDCRSIPYSAVTSVYSKTEENETASQSVPDKRITYFPNSSNTMEILLESSKAEKEEGNQLKISPMPNDVSKVTPNCDIKCKTITTPITLPQNDAKEYNLRLLTTLPNARIIPKLTQTEIIKKLANMRFPVIIRPKEQWNSSIEVEIIDAQQFDGLENHIWPFMIEWQENTQFNNRNKIKEVNCKENVNQLNANYDNDCSDQDSSKLNITNVKVAKHSNLKTKKPVNGTSKIKTKKDLKRIAISPNSNTFQAQTPISQFKDRMLNLLHRKVSGNILDKDFRNKTRSILFAPCNTKMKTEASTRIQIESTAKVKERPPIKKQESPVHFLNNKSEISFKYPWAKAKRASDFIENVIKNIRNGVYYSKDHKHGNRITEVAMQTDPTSDQEEISENYFSPKVTIKKKNSIAVIPGFDRSLLGLEVKTLNMKQIAIKHCVTNVMIQFDVTVPAVIENIAKRSKTSASVVPIEVTETHTKIFKCKTSILNAMLPAELCSIVPTMMKAIDSGRKSIVNPYTTPLVDKTKTNLSTISEIPRSEVTKIESNNNFGSLAQNFSALKKILDGIFSKPRNYISESVYKYQPNYEYSFVITLLPKLDDKVLTTLTTTITSITSIKPAYPNPPRNVLSGVTKSVSDLLISSKSNKCNAVEVYSTKNKRLMPAIKPYNFADFLNSILKSQAFWFISKIHSDTKTCLYRNVSVINVIIHNMTIFPQFYKDVTVPKCNDTTTKSVQYMKRSANRICPNKDQQPEHYVNKVANNKYKRKTYYKLYRKCKSTSSIPSIEKNTNTPLNKIQTLEEFLQILGSKQMLSGVFDGYAAKKILASIVEMKNWITEINPRQALLILLLCNKKDTPNLIRYRPVLLQGIAVNRITRATELDMEIEVIERESLNKLPQYEGISYITASVENHDQLLEELNWIAKTTLSLVVDVELVPVSNFLFYKASDYQRPFDESSEKLLKSLLEKRKKLNPSYLRVMARYVGLGLLKRPRKNEHCN